MRYLVFIFVVLSLFGCNCDYYDSLPEGDRYGMIGDSIFSVGGDECENVGHYLSLLMGEKITNDAVGGARVELIFSSYPGLLEKEPDLQIVMVDGGWNNILDGDPTNNILEVLTNVFVAILASERTPIYLLPHHGFGVREEYNPAVDDLDDSLLLVCEQLEIVCLDLRDYFDLHPEYFGDGLHLNVTGRSALAEILQSYL